MSEAEFAAPEIMEVLPIGCKVEIADQMQMIGAITAITFRQGVSYEVVWWNAGDRKSAWMEAAEVKPTIEREKTRIGFTQGY